MEKRWNPYQSRLITSLWIFLMEYSIFKRRKSHCICVKIMQHLRKVVLVDDLPPFTKYLATSSSWSLPVPAYVDNVDDCEVVYGWCKLKFKFELCIIHSSRNEGEHERETYYTNERFRFEFVTYQTLVFGGFSTFFHRNIWIDWNWLCNFGMYIPDTATIYMYECQHGKSVE